MPVTTAVTIPAECGKKGLYKPEAGIDFKMKEECLGDEK